MKMKTSANTVILLTGLLLALSGCGSIKERKGYEAGAGKGRPLEVPPDLVLPQTNGKYVVPDGSVTTSATYSEYSRSSQCSCAQPVAQQTPASAPVVTAPPAPVLKRSKDGIQVITLAETFDRCWHRVGQALDRANLAIEDKDRSKGIFYLGEGVQLTVQGMPAGSNDAVSCTVIATDAAGKPSNASDDVIKALYPVLGGK